MNDHTNIVRIKAISRALVELGDRFAFVGGATVSLYSDRPNFEVRPTEDVDVIVEILSYADHIQLDAQLRKIGFKNDMSSGVICRYIYGSTIVDVVPTTADALGFANRWYPEGFNNAIQITLGDVKVKILTAPYFIATKLEAFKDRGKNDGRTSQDFEDIIFVLENRRVIWDELNKTTGELRKYLQDTFGSLMNKNAFPEWVRSHVFQMGSPPADFFILPRLEEFVKQKNLQIKEISEEDIK